MKHTNQTTTLISATAMTLLLAACGSDEGNNQATNEADTTAAVEEKGTKVIDNVEEMVREKVAEIKETIALDTSSLDSFKSSLSAMRSSLSDDQAGQLRDALGYLAKSSAKESKGGLLGAAKSVASGKSMEEILYDNMADKLDGLTFDDILNLAG